MNIDALHAIDNALGILAWEQNWKCEYVPDRHAELVTARAAIAELIEAAREGSATLGHIYHTTPLHPELEQYAHDGYQRLDAAIAGVSPPKAHKHCDHSWAVKMVTGGPVRVCQNCGLVPPDAALARVGGA